MKGIVMAGGTASRLYPASLAGNKHLFPVLDKPMVYYPLSTLILAGVRDVMLVSSPADLHRFRDILGDGAHLGLSVSYASQPQPNGIPGGLSLGRDFLAGDRVALILGDNIFLGPGLPALLQRAIAIRAGAVILGCRVADPARYGVVETDAEGRAVALTEKPVDFRSDCAVTGLYFLDADVVDIVDALTLSARNEYEITDVNREYLRRGALHLLQLGSDVSWVDAGTPEGLLTATERVRELTDGQAVMPGCIEEAAWRAGFIDDAQLARLVASMPSSGYRSYLGRLLAAET